MDSDAVHWIITDNQNEASVTTISEPSSAVILDDDVLVRSVWTDSRAAQLDVIPTVSPAEIADAVWDEALADHNTEDSMGNVINDLTLTAADVFQRGGVAWWAHIGGFVFGLAVIRLIASRPATQYAGQYHPWRDDRWH